MNIDTVYTWTVTCKTSRAPSGLKVGEQFTSTAAITRRIGGQPLDIVRLTNKLAREPDKQFTYRGVTFCLSTASRIKKRGGGAS